MPGLLTLPVACAALVCGPVDQEVGLSAPAMPPAPPAVATAPQTPMTPQPAKMVDFDGGWEFLKTSRQLRVWRRAVAFEMTVDTEGHATECEVVDRFRKNYVNIKLCEVVMNHYTFEPARDEKNEPTMGSYRASISYQQLREELE